MQDEPNDTSSNPTADDHLPASGEFDSQNVPDDSSPLNTSEYEDDEDEDEDDLAAASDDEDAEEELDADTPLEDEDVEELEGEDTDTDSSDDPFEKDGEEMPQP